MKSCTLLPHLHHINVNAVSQLLSYQTVPGETQLENTTQTLNYHTPLDDKYLMQGLTSQTSCPQKETKNLCFVYTAVWISLVHHVILLSS